MARACARHFGVVMADALIWRYRDGFGLDHLELVREPLPRPSAGQVLLEMRAASLNFRDLAVLEGRMGSRVKPPLIPLSDGAGVVAALGAGVDNLAVGKRVTPSFFQNWQDGPPPQSLIDGRLGGPLDGCLATHRVFPAKTLVPVHGHLTDAEAATLPCAGVTAWSALTEPQPVVPGDGVLIHGSGGVAMFALSLAKAMRARCVVTTSTEVKAAQLKGLGADAVVLRSTPDWPDLAIEANGGRFHRVLELGGAATLNGSIRAVRTGGLVFLIGNVTGSTAKLDLSPILTRNLTLKSVSCGPTRAHHSLADFMARHELRPVIARTFAFQDAPSALVALRDGGHFGKLCIQIGGPDAATLA